MEAAGGVRAGEMEVQEGLPDRQELPPLIPEIPALRRDQEAAEAEAQSIERTPTKLPAGREAVVALRET